jgi:thiopeptide-type bacteriocin biosynthesis protein
MPDICFNPYLFLRTPALSYEEYNCDALEIMLKNKFFQSAIFFASESLYMELNRCDFNYQLLDKKVKLSLQKYFNRMCYRPTPFGMCSAFTSLNWSVFRNSETCILENEREIYVNPDFQFTVDIARKMEKSGAFNHVKYYSNNAIYTIKGEKRYLTNCFDSDQRKTDFLIASYQADRLLNKLISFCKKGKTKIEVTAWLNDFIGDENEVGNYVEDLIDAGLLISELYPNMSGQKYFDRLISIILNENNKTEFAKEILNYENLLNGIKNENDVNVNSLLENKLYSISQKKLKSMFYVGYEKKSQSSLDKKYQECIRDGLNCLHRFTTDATPKSLITFKNRFKTRFEDQEIPILQALDREAGIGYEGLETNLITSELLDGIQLDLQSNSLNFNWTPIHEFFLFKLSKTKNDDSILISDKDLEKIHGQSELKVPPSFSVIFRIFGDKIWIEQAGGCTATALLGRFTLFSEKVLEEARYIASVEEKFNEDVIFAEISCFNDEHAANINSNSGIRTYEIPIGVHSTLDRDKIIDLSDITISVINNIIILRSKKLNRLIVPRLSSAFNYGRSELSIFRFLCDMQYQGLKFNYNFDLRSLLPGLNFYPRVEYKNCILYPSTWILNAEEIAEITDGSDTNGNFKRMGEKLKLKKHFALTEGDNQLLFDLDDDESIELFVKVIKNKNSVILQEVFFDESASVVNRIGQPFVGQFIASVFANESSYTQRPLEPASRKKSKIKRIYLPGDEWLYLKLYCHPATSNSILTNSIKSVITRLKKQNILKSWYFIRYADPDHHLRIRIQINRNDASDVMRCFEKKLRKHVEKGSVNNMLLDTYKREIERYGGDTIEHVEKIFHASSELIINYLKNITREQPDRSELHLAIISVDAILEVFFSQNFERIFLLKCLHDGMKHEFEDSKQVKFQMDTKYREYSWFINNMNTNKKLIAGIAGKKEFNSYLKALSLLKANSLWLLPDKLMKLVGDVIHMHLNRLFNEKQRNHEFIIYYLLHKYYLSLEARKEKESLAFSPASKGLRIDHINEAVFK